MSITCWEQRIDALKIASPKKGYKGDYEKIKKDPNLLGGGLWYDARCLWEDFWQWKIICYFYQR